MKQKIIIYGAGLTGRKAYSILKEEHEVLFFVDKDEKKHGTEIDGILVYSPKVLSEYKNVKLIIASVYSAQIIEELAELEGLDVYVWNMELIPASYRKMMKELDLRTIDLGCFLYQNSAIFCKELTFLPGGSGVLDYAFLLILAKKFGSKKYLEIGTYIGESINILTDVCEQLYSITAPLDASFSMSYWCKQHNMPDYSERLAYDSKIVHYYADSKMFDYSLLPDDIDLFFIDGDHSYNGVYNDTKNIFSIKKKDAIVVWHDFKMERNEYNNNVVQAVRDAIGNDFTNVYVTNNNKCGVYLPDKYKEYFKLEDKKYEVNGKLYTYDVSLHVKINE